MYWHKQKYTTELSEGDYTQKLHSLIEINKENSLKNHFFSYRFEEKIQGVVKENHFTVWRKIGSWSGYLYPIFKGEKEKIDDLLRITIKTRFNPIGYIIISLLTITLSIFIFSSVLGQGNFALKYILLRGVFGVIIFLLFHTVPIVLYYSIKKQTLKSLEVYFQLTKVKC